jgi:hypothetical protein
MCPLDTHKCLHAHTASHAHEPEAAPRAQAGVICAQGVRASVSICATSDARNNRTINPISFSASSFVLRIALDEFLTIECVAQYHTACANFERSPATDCSRCVTASASRVSCRWELLFSHRVSRPLATGTGPLRKVFRVNFATVAENDPEQIIIKSVAASELMNNIHPTDLKPTHLRPPLYNVYLKRDIKSNAI